MKDGHRPRLSLPLFRRTRISTNDSLDPALTGRTHRRPEGGSGSPRQRRRPARETDKIEKRDSATSFGVLG